VESATTVAQDQYKSLLAGLQAVSQVKGGKVQQLLFVGGTWGSILVESFNRNMKTLGVLESKWDPICKKLVRHLLEEQDKVIQSYFAQKGGTRNKGEVRRKCKGRECPKCTREDGTPGSWPSAPLSLQWGAWKFGVFCLSIIFFGLSKFVKFVVN